MIRSIELINWKTHRHTKLEFRKGVNVLIGVMGAGKSSVMDAISFSLFGTFPALKQGRIKLDSIPTNRPYVENDSEVKLAFDVGEDTYVVSRKVFKNKKSEAYLERNGKHLQTQSERVTEEIESVLKLDYDTFSRAIYSEQNRLDYFLQLRKGERKKEIDQMLGLDHFATVEENTTSLINGIKNLEKEDAQLASGIDGAAIRDSISKIKVEISQAEKEAVENGERAKKLGEEVNAIKSEVEKAKEENDKRIKLEREIAEMESTIKAKKSETKKINDMGIDGKLIDAELAESSSKEHKLSESSAKIKKDEIELQKSLAVLHERMDLNTKKIEEKRRIEKDIGNGAVEELYAKLKECSERMEKAIAEAASGSSRAEELKELITELNRHKGVCPVCERKLEDELRERLLKKNNEELERLKGRLEVLKRETKRDQDEKETIESQIKRLEKLSGRLEEYKDVEHLVESDRKMVEPMIKKVRDTEELLKKNESELDGVRDRIRELRSKHETLKRKAELEKEIAAVEKDLGKRLEEHKSMKIDQDSVDALQDRFNSRNSEYQKVLAIIQESSKSLKTLKQQLKDRTDQLNGLIEIEKRIRARRDQEDLLIKFKGAIIETEGLLRNRLVSSINSILDNLWPWLYPYGDYIGVKLNAYNDDYSLEAGITIDGKEQWVAVDSVASGGERSIASLAMRIALGMTIVPNLKWIILDEPTHNLDSAGIGKLISVLGEKLPGIVEQIFIITHDESLKGISHANVIGFERDKNNSGSTAIMQN